jgi:hypothetical protein
MDRDLRAIWRCNLAASVTPSVAVARMRFPIFKRFPLFGDDSRKEIALFAAIGVECSLGQAGAS